MKATKENCRSAANRLSSLLSRMLWSSSTAPAPTAWKDIEYVNEFLDACEHALPSEDDSTIDKTILDETLKRR